MERETMDELAHQQRTHGGLRDLALFAGAGGGILGGKLLGWRTVCAVEINSFCARRLMQRQNEGHLPPFPIWDDVCTFDGRPWRGIVDVVSGGFPCQDISCAGKGAGLEGTRSGLWFEMARIISEVRPRFAFVENTANVINRGLPRIASDFHAMGYNTRWGIFSACSVGAPHMRKRMFLVAHSRALGWDKISRVQPKANYQAPRMWETCVKNDLRPFIGECTDSSLSNGVRISDVVADELDRIAAIGNGQVPAVVRLAWKMLTGDYDGKEPA